jgi:hypothetical protein
MAGSSLPVSRFQQRGAKRSTGAGGRLRPRLRRYFSTSVPVALLVVAQFDRDLIIRRQGAFGPQRSRHHLSSELCDRRAKIDMVGTHDEADRVAVRAAAEAMKKTLVLDDVERRGSLLVERAETGIFTPAPLQLDAAADELGQPDAAAQLVEKFRRVVHSAQSRSPGCALRTAAITASENLSLIIAIEKERRATRPGSPSSSATDTGTSTEPSVFEDAQSACAAVLGFQPGRTPRKPRSRSSAASKPNSPTRSSTGSSRRSRLGLRLVDT